MKAGKKPIATRTLWVESLAEELSKPPFGDFSIDAVARKLGVTKGSFYHYFEDKDAALGVLVEEWRVELDRLAPIDQWSSEPGIDLERFIARVASVEPSQLHRSVYLLLVLLPEEHPTCRQILSIHLERNKRYHAIFDRLGLPREHADLLLYTILANYLGFTLFQQSGLLVAGVRTPISDDRMRAFMARLISHAATLI